MIRLCGCTDGTLHVDPEIDWIGNTPITHGEYERDVPGSDTHVRGCFDAYCLCGHPNYLTCPKVFGDEGTVWGMTVEAGESP